MKTIQFIFVVFLQFSAYLSFAQVDLSKNESETKFDKVKKSDLQIQYKGRSFSFGESFESVSNKIGNESIYAGTFDARLQEVDDYFEGIANYMIIYENADFFFENSKFSYFEITSNQFLVKLRSNVQDNNGVVNLRVGKSANVLNKVFKNTFAQKIKVGDYYRDRFIINLGDLNGADSPIANDLIISVEKGSDKISRISFYGY